MGYITDSYVLVPANSSVTAGTWFTPPAPAAGVSYQFAGSDFVRGIVRVNVTAAASAGTALAVAFQSSPDGGTTWYPGAAGLPFASTPGYQSVTAAVAAASQWAFPLTTFPGALFRLAVLVTGGTGLTLSATGDFQKVVPDNS